MDSIRSTRRNYNIQSPVLENPLLTEQERAFLYELDQDFARDKEKQGNGMNFDPRFTRCLKDCETYCCTDKGVLSLIAVLFVSIIGTGVLVLAEELSLPEWVSQLGRYALSAGVFGLASGATNWIAVFGLFYRIPGLIGSGVFHRQHRKIRHIVKIIVLQMLFDSQHLENYILKKINHFTSNVQIVDNITAALNSPEAERIIEEKLEHLFVQPEGDYLCAVGINKVRLRAVVKPAVISLCSETAPTVLGAVLSNRGEGISVSQFREEFDRYLSWRSEALSQKAIGRLMRMIMYHHLSWVVVWGSVFGLLTGLVVQALHLSFDVSFLFT